MIAKEFHYEKDYKTTPTKNVLAETADSALSDEEFMATIEAEQAQCFPPDFAERVEELMRQYEKEPCTVRRRQHKKFMRLLKYANAFAKSTGAKIVSDIDPSERRVIIRIRAHTFFVYKKLSYKPLTKMLALSHGFHIMHGSNDITINLMIHYFTHEYDPFLRACEEIEKEKKAN